MPEYLPDLPRYVRQCGDEWQGADHQNGPWRPIPAPQSGLPWRTDGPAVPEGREPASVTEQPSDKQARDLADDLGITRGHVDHECGMHISCADLEPFAAAILARWGHQPKPAPVPVSERLPEPNAKVLAHYFNALGKGRTICAIWVPAKSRDDDVDFREGATHLLLTWDEAAVQVHAADRARYCRPVIEVSQERADDALNCLPPFRWTRQSIHASSWEAFALGEPLTDRLVWWFVRLGHRWFELVEDRMISYETLVGAVRGSEAFLQTGLAA